MGILSNFFGVKKKIAAQQQKNKRKWISYFSKVDGRPGLIWVDLDLKNLAPLKDKPILGWISIRMNNPQVDGLSSAKETALLNKVEEELIDELTINYNGVCVGRIVSQGSWDIYVYFGLETDCDIIFKKGMEKFEYYAFGIGQRMDAEWKCYTDFLFPHLLQFVKMKKNEQANPL